MRRYILEISVFAGGFVVMVLELVGSRLLAPHIGTSLVVWTSVIGVILASLSVGYWWGGVLADEYAGYKKYSSLFFLAAVLMLVLLYIGRPLLLLLRGSGLGLHLQAVAASVILFAPATVVLGMISPYAVKLKLQELSTSGVTVGRLYALSTVGSIIGTFATGFVLLAHMGTTKILLLLALLLLAVSFLVYVSWWRWQRLGAGALVLALLLVPLPTQVLSQAQGLVADMDSPYNRWLVIDGMHSATGRRVRSLATSAHGTQSAMFLDGADEPVAEYIKYYRLAEHFHPDMRRALLIGGGAYTFPRYFLRDNPKARMDVVEIDPVVTRLARQYFRLTDDPRLSIYHQDARVFLSRSAGGYDVIFGDTFKTFYDLPFHLTTREATQAVFDALQPDGMYIVNIIAALEGDKAKFFEAEYATFSAVFPQAFAFPVQADSVSEVQNIILIGLKSAAEPAFLSPDAELTSYLEKRYTPRPGLAAPVLTDDYAPVENYAAKLVE